MARVFIATTLPSASFPLSGFAGEVIFTSTTSSFIANFVLPRLTKTSGSFSPILTKPNPRGLAEKVPLKTAASGCGNIILPPVVISIAFVSSKCAIVFNNAL